MRYLIVLLLFTLSSYAQRGNEMMLASYAQANQFVVVEETVSSKIAASSDDYEEESITGAAPFGTTSGDLEIGYGNATYPRISLGLRFLGLNIPQGSTITNAYIQFSAERTSTGTSPVIEIYGIDQDNTVTFSNTATNLSGRPKTTATVSWTGLPSWTVDARGVAQQTSDITSIIQEIVDRGGYTSSSAIGIEIRAASNNSTFTRRGKSYDLSTTEAAELFVTYETLQGPPPPTPSDAITAVNPDVYYNPSSIDATAVNDGDVVTVWNDLSANGIDATAVNTIHLNLAGTDRMVEFRNGTSYFDLPTNAALNKTIGTDEFTFIVREGAVIPNTGYAISKADATSSIREYGFYYSSNPTLIMAGTTLSFTSTAGTRRLFIVVVRGNQLDVYQDGVVLTDNRSVNSLAPQSQSVNIGGRSDGGFLIQSGGQLDLIAVIPKALTLSERQAIEAEWQIN